MAVVEKGKARGRDLCRQGFERLARGPRKTRQACQPTTAEELLRGPQTAQEENRKRAEKTISGKHWPLLMEEKGLGRENQESREQSQERWKVMPRNETGAWSRNHPVRRLQRTFPAWLGNRTVPAMMHFPCPRGWAPRPDTPSSTSVYLLRT